MPGKFSLCVVSLSLSGLILCVCVSLYLCVRVFLLNFDFTFTSSLTLTLTLRSAQIHAEKLTETLLFIVMKVSSENRAKGSLSSEAIFVSGLVLELNNKQLLQRTSFRT